MGCLYHNTPESNLLFIRITGASCSSQSIYLRAVVYSYRWASSVSLYSHSESPHCDFAPRSRNTVTRPELVGRLYVGRKAAVKAVVAVEPSPIMT